MTAIIVIVGLLGCLSAAGASAAPAAVGAFGYSRTFANQGQITISGTYPDPNSAIGVEPGTGNVLVGKNYEGLIFAPDAQPADAPIGEFPGPGAPNFVVDQATGDIYFSSPFSGTIIRLVPGGGPTPTYSVDSSYNVELVEPAISMAIDPTTGDLLVAQNGTREIVRLNASGIKISSFLSSSSEALHPTRVAVSSNGTIFVAEQEALKRFTPAGVALGSCSVTVPAGVGRIRSLASDPIHGTVDFIVSDQEFVGPSRVESCSPAGVRTFSIPLPAETDDDEPMGLAVDPESGKLYVLTGLVEAGQGAPGDFGVNVFNPAIYPGVETPEVLSVTSTTALVRAEVDPGTPLPAGSYAKFEYSADQGAHWSETPQIDDASGIAEAEITGLNPNFTYLVRAVAGNELISHAGNATSLTTAPVPPVVVTGGVTDIAESEATLSGTINAVGLQTTYHFEYGTTPSYGSGAPATAEAIAGNGRTARLFSRAISGLQPGTTYHYRLVARNAAGGSASEDRTFTTAVANPLSRRFYEQVTPLDKLGGSIEPKIGFQVGKDGSDIAYITYSPGDTASSPLYGRLISRRTESGWEAGVPADPPMNTSRTTVFATTLAISSDFTHAFVASNRALLPGAIENETNLYVVDLATGAYKFVAATEAQNSFNSFVGAEEQKKFISGTSDFDSIVFASRAPLLPGVTATAIYRWSDGEGLRLESTLRNGTTPAAPAEIATAAGVRWTSEDLDRIYFSLEGFGGGEEGIYLNEGGTVRAISVSHRPGDNPEEVIPGGFLGASANGRYAFFWTWYGQLTADAPEATGNVYRYDAVTGALQYLGEQVGRFDGRATLGVSEDGSTIYLGGNQISVWREGRLSTVPGGASGPGEGASSPDGRFFAYQPFTSTEERLGEGEPLYLYDADTEVESCASCLSDGSNPGGVGVWEQEGFVSNQQPSHVSNDGAVYFDTAARLVAGDVNGVRDVYEYRNGEDRLISPGTLPFPARYADRSADGRDVYFTTTQQLVGQDEDRAMDIYDARIGGGLPSQNPEHRAECAAESCSANLPSAPSPSANGSETNVSAHSQQKAKSKPNKRKKPRQCSKAKRSGSTKGKRRCAKPRHKKASHNRRQGR